MVQKGCCLKFNVPVHSKFELNQWESLSFSDFSLGLRIFSWLKLRVYCFCEVSHERLQCVTFEIDFVRNESFFVCEFFFRARPGMHTLDPDDNGIAQKSQKWRSVWFACLLCCWMHPLNWSDSGLDSDAERRCPLSRNLFWESLHGNCSIETISWRSSRNIYCWSVCSFEEKSSTNGIRKERVEEGTVEKQALEIKTSLKMFLLGGSNLSG